MAILGYNTKGALSTQIQARKYASKWTLAATSTLTELHGWFGASGSGPVTLILHSDTAGSPGARVAYTAPLAYTSGDAELVQTGFSVSLPAGDYWIGWASVNGTVNAYYDNGVIAYKGLSAGLAADNPPSDPFGSTDVNGTRSYSCWAVVTAGGGGGGGGSILERKAGAASVDTDDWAAVVDAVVALGGNVATRKSGSGAVSVTNYNAVVDAVVALGGSVATRKAGSGDVDPVSYNALVDAVKLLGAA